MIIQNKGKKKYIKHWPVQQILPKASNGNTFAALDSDLSSE